MPLAKTIYFTQVSGDAPDWIRVVNIGNERAKVLVVARDPKGKTVWSDSEELAPFQAWTPPVDNVPGGASIEVRSDEPIVGERHCHVGRNTFDFPGAAPEYGTVGRRVFFPEIYSGGNETLRIFNVGENEAMVNIVVRDPNGRIIKQLSNSTPVFGWWFLTDRNFGQVDGTLEIQSTQPIVAERHLYYASGAKGAVGQLGQVLD